MIGMYRIARREYLQLVKSVGFVVLVLLLPILGGAGFIIPQILQSTEPTRYITIIDQTGVYEQDLIDSFAYTDKKRALDSWDGWTQFALLPEAFESDTIPEVFLVNPANSTIEDPGRLERFYQAGGFDAAREAVSEYKRPNMPNFTPLRGRIAFVPSPATIDTSMSLEDVGEAISPYIRGDKTLEIEGRSEQLFAAILISTETSPVNTGPASVQGITRPKVNYWSANIAINDIPAQVRGVVIRTLKYNAYTQNGVPIQLVKDVNTLNVNVTNFQPEDDGTDAKIETVDLIKKFLPVLFAYLLFLSVFSIGNLLLTSVIEEKSNKIVEVLLSSVTAHEIMSGKLIGLAAVSLTAISLWAMMGFGLTFAVTRDLSMVQAGADLVMANGLLPWFLLFYLLGYLMFASMFLAVGSMSQSIQDAQAYLGPISMILIMPLTLIIFVLRDPNGIVAQILTWIPLYTPYVLLVRLGANIPPWELYGATAFLAVTSLGMVWLMGRLFHRSILNAGQPPKWREVLGLLKR